MTNRDDTGMDAARGENRQVAGMERDAASGALIAGGTIGFAASVAALWLASLLDMAPYSKVELFAPWAGAMFATGSFACRIWGWPDRRTGRGWRFRLLKSATAFFAATVGAYASVLLFRALPPLPADRMLYLGAATVAVAGLIVPLHLAAHAALFRASGSPDSFASPAARSDIHADIEALWGPTLPRVVVMGGALIAADLLQSAAVPAGWCHGVPLDDTGLVFLVVAIAGPNTLDRWQTLRLCIAGFAGGGLALLAMRSAGCIGPVLARAWAPLGDPALVGMLAAALVVLGHIGLSAWLDRRAAEQRNRR